MNILLNWGLIGLPASFLFFQIQSSASNPSTDNWQLVREIGTFILSVLLAWAVKYIRESRAEVKAAKAQLPSAIEVNSIKDDYVIIKADLALMTDTLERTRRERDEAHSLANKAIKALENANRLLEEERSVNINYGKAAEISDEKIRQLELQVEALRAGNKLVDQFAIQFMARIELLLVDRLAKSNRVSEENVNVQDS